MIAIKNLNLKVGTFELKDINLEIKKGEYFVILGPTGAGKSLILKCIAGLNKMDSGELFIDNKLSNNIPIEERDIGYVFQDSTLFPHLNVYQNITFGLRLKRMPKSLIEKKVSNICKLFGICHLLKRPVDNLSGGERQRVSLARSMICEPKAILLDEPFSSLDRNTAERLMIEIKRIHAQTRQTIIHVTHNHEEAAVLADRICILKDGSIVQVGTFNEILTKPNSEFVADFFCTHNIFSGFSVIEGNVSKIEYNGICIYSSQLRGGKVAFSIRPEDVAISLNKEKGEGINSFRGTIKEIIDRGVIIQILVDVGFPIVSYSLRSSFLAMGLKEGDSVNIYFDKNAVHII